MSRRSLVFGFFVLLGSVGHACWAVDPTLHLSQYAHTAWRMQDGVFQGIPQTIAQTTDGYLWIGTNDGLVRFDGVRFAPWKPPAQSALPNQSIFSLLADLDGSLWIGTGRGLVHWTHTALVNYPESFGRINAIAKDRDGVVWIARTRQKSGEGPLCRVKGEAT